MKVRENFRITKRLTGTSADDGNSRQVIKHSRWLLLRNPENLPAGHDVRLSELLAVNQPLNTVYVLKAA